MDQGSCGNWVDRSSTYKTSYPPHTLLETIFKKEFVKVSSTTHGNYVSGGTEWITKTLTLEDVYKLLHGNALEEYLADAERKVREKEIQEQKNMEYDEYLTLCEKNRRNKKTPRGNSHLYFMGTNIKNM